MYKPKRNIEDKIGKICEHESMSATEILGWVKNFAVFSNMKHNLAVLDTFDKVMKVMSYTGLWDTELTWYSLSATCWSSLYDLIVKFFATWVKFL